MLDDRQLCLRQLRPATGLGLTVEVSGAGRNFRPAFIIYLNPVAAAEAAALALTAFAFSIFFSTSFATLNSPCVAWPHAPHLPLLALCFSAQDSQK